MTFSPRQLSLSTVQALAEAFQGRLLALIDHCLSADAGGKTASDFDLVDLSTDQFDRLAGMLGKLDG